MSTRPAYISLPQLRSSLDRLKLVHPFFGIAFLSFKLTHLPVGRSTTLNFSSINREFLNSHFRVSSSYAGYYHPFQSVTGWVAPEYSRTSLQRICADTFKDAFIHPNGTSLWGFARGYVDALVRHLSRTKIPLFDLAVWIYRTVEWKTTVAPADLRARLVSEFGITDDERSNLFDESAGPITDWRSASPLSEDEIISLTGLPPGTPPKTGAALRFLAVTGVGPARSLRYEPGPKLNIVTGDNSLGKTFLLELIWSALTGNWRECALLPRENASKSGSRVVYGVTTGLASLHETTVTYDWARQAWQGSLKPTALPGLVIFARFDGSFSVWDPAQTAKDSPSPGLRFSRSDIWDGLALDIGGERRPVCNGLVRDWVTWQTSPRHQDKFAALRAALSCMSPAPNEEIRPAEPTRLPSDSREIPTVEMSYGIVPVLHASAGVQRIIALAYFLVWAWYEHLALTSRMRREPQRRIILLIDEIEAHLHPRWQRVIVPALMAAVEKIEASVALQIHLATHSPLVLASAETTFSSKTDCLHHLSLEANTVRLETLEFVKRGRADLWLMSSVFGLAQPRSVPAEAAMHDAKSLQLKGESDPKVIAEVHARLKANLPQDDEFWPRWLYWAEQRGVKD